MTRVFSRVRPAVPILLALGLATDVRAQTDAAAADPAGAEAADALASGAESPWRVEFTTWIWIMGLSGDVGIRDRTSEVDASFGDILDASDSIFALSGRLEIAYERFGLFVDGFYSDLGVDDASSPAGVGDIDVTLQQAIVDFGAMYRLIDNEPSGDAAKNHHNLTLDLYAGGRYSSTELTLDPANFPERSHTEDWVDPILGAKVVLPFAENWHVAVNADIGGFGVSSDITWSATAVVGYDFRLFDIRSSAMVGYRAIGWDYSSDDEADFQWDIIQHGIIIGLGMRF